MVDGRGVVIGLKAGHRVGQHGNSRTPGDGAGRVGHLQRHLMLPGGREDDDGIGQLQAAAVAQIPDGTERTRAGDVGLQPDGLADGNGVLGQQIADERRDAEPQRGSGRVFPTLVAQQSSDALFWNQHVGRLNDEVEAELLGLASSHDRQPVDAVLLEVEGRPGRQSEDVAAKAARQAQRHRRRQRPAAAIADPGGQAQSVAGAGNGGIDHDFQGQRPTFDRGHARIEDGRRRRLPQQEEKARQQQQTPDRQPSRPGIHRGRSLAESGH